MHDKSLKRKYKYAGIARIGEKTKMHFTNDKPLQTKRLVTSGASEVAFTDLPSPMNRLEAARFLLEKSEYQKKPEIQGAIIHVISRFAD